MISKRLYWKARDWLAGGPGTHWYREKQNPIAIGEDGKPIEERKDGYLPKDRIIVKIIEGDKYPSQKPNRKKASCLALFGLCAVLALSGCDKNKPKGLERKVEAPVNVEERKKGERIISQSGIELIKKYEGFKGDIYRCPAGKDTIGYGHLIKKGEEYRKITRAKAEELLKSDVQRNFLLRQKTLREINFSYSIPLPEGQV